VSVVALRSVFLWCAFINWVVLALWGLSMLMPHPWLYRLVGRWYRISPEQIDTMTYGGILAYQDSGSRLQPRPLRRPVNRR
jgi:Family of unknown function (DUF6868)